MEPDRMTAVQNEWMRRYIEDPHAFRVEFQTVSDFVAAKNEGREPDYGERCTAYMLKLEAEMFGEKEAT